MRERPVLYVWVLLCFASSEVLARYLGIHFAMQPLETMYQYLDPELLCCDLLRSLFYLHAQPPLFNLFLGIVLKLTPSPAVAFSFIYGGMALGMLLGVSWLMRRLEVPDVVNGLLCLLFALSPSFPAYRYWLFYTLPVAFLLVMSAVALSIYLSKKSSLALAAFAACVGATMLTRSVFHPIWLVVVAVLLLPHVASRRRFLIACLVPFLIVNLWFLKNAVLVGSYSGSTWLGLSLTKRWPLSQKHVAELKSLERLPAYWGRRPYQEPAYFKPYGFFRETEGRHPAIDDAYKASGQPNFNHRDYVVISDSLLEADLGLMARYPGRYLRRTLTAMMLFLQPGPNSVHFLVEYDFEHVHQYRDLWTQYLFLGGRVERPIRMLAPPFNLWMLLFPLLMLVAIRGKPRGLCLYILATILWLTAVTNMIEIGENDRMRWEIEPFLVVLTGVAMARVLAFLGRLKRA